MSNNHGDVNVTIFDAAKFIFKKLKRSITQMELYKLLWFCQGWHYCYTDRPLFNEEFEAWRFGPVPTILWLHFRGRVDLTVEDFMGLGRLSRIQGKSREIVKAVLDYYGDFSSGELSYLSHKCDPWIDHVDKVDQSIPNDAIREYFQQFRDSGRNLRQN